MLHLDKAENAGDHAVVFFFSSRRRHTRLQGDWSSDVCSSDLKRGAITQIGNLLARVGWTIGAGDADSAKTKAVLGELIAAGPNPPSVDELSARQDRKSVV